MRRFRRRVVRRCPRWLYRWIDRRGRIPWLVRLLWPKAHWCPDMDFLLIVDNVIDCFCGVCAREQRIYQRRFYRAVTRQQAKYDATPRDGDLF